MHFNEIGTNMELEGRQGKQSSKDSHNFTRLLPPSSKQLRGATGPLSKSDFKATKSLGEGSFGKVFLCKFLNTSEEFAVKAINKEKIKSSSMLKQIRQEISLMESISHPNIVQLLSYFENETHIYLILELGGSNLYSLLNRRKSFTEKEAAQVLTVC